MSQRLAADRSALEPLLTVTLDALDRGVAARGGPLPAGDPSGPREALARVLATHADRAGEGGKADGSLPVASRDRPAALPTTGIGAEAALSSLVEILAAGHTDPADPLCAAHLHCPPLAVAVAADLAVSVLNPSLDSWDQGPSSAAVEDQVIAALAELIGFAPETAGGTMTTGGTASTMTALLLAREAAAPRPLRIVCSDQAHFSVQRAAHLLGLADDAVVTVPTGDDGRIDVAAVRATLAGSDAALPENEAAPAASDPPADAVAPSSAPSVPPGDPAWAIVATAGTTDLGAVDPLLALASIAREHDAWLHVDAAFGGGALFSDRLAPLLTGIDRADSVSLDTHKLGWQPVAAGAVILRERARMAPLDRQVAYLNAADDDAAGYEDRLGRSLRTTRRPDAFKLLVTMQALGRTGLGELVDRCHGLALIAADAVTRDVDLELHSAPTLSTILLRPTDEDPVRRDDRSAEIRRLLLREGRAVVGRTELPGEGPGRRWLKLTLINPAATGADVRALVALVGDAARQG